MKALALTIMLCLFSMTTNAQQSPICASWKEITTVLEEKFNEVPTAAFLQENGYLIVIFTSLEGSVTVIERKPGNNKACIISIGEHWAYSKPQRGQQS